MLLWDIIRDWFVMNIWGGTASNSVLYLGGSIGQWRRDNGSTVLVKAAQLFIPLDFLNNGEVGALTLGDWLSTTSTIIVLVAVCFALYFLVRYFFRMFAGLLSGR